MTCICNVSKKLILCDYQILRFYQSDISILFVDNSDVTLPAVDPRTISPSGNNGFESERSSIEEANNIKIEPDFKITKNSFHYSPINEVNTNTQKKLVIKARRNIKPKVN